MLQLRSATRKLFIAATLCAACGASGQHPDPGDRSRLEITHLLELSAAAWSHDDFDTFMGLYEAAPTTDYVNRKQVIHGFEAIRDFYRARFAGRAPGSAPLTMEVLQFHAIGPDHAVVIGRYVLRGATPAEGIFTLVFHRGATGWHIVVDHTS